MLLTLLTIFISLIFNLASVKAQVVSTNLSFTPSTINPGAVSTLSITLFNSSPSQALTNTGLTNNLPTGMTVANPSNITNNCGGTVTATPGTNSFSLSGGTVPKKVGFTDGECTFAVNVTTAVQGNSINTIPVNALTNDQGQTNNTPASATLQVRAMNAPALSKILNPNTIYITDGSTLTITLTNTDLNIDLTNVGVTDNLPANLTVAASPAPTTTCSGGTVANTSTNVTLSGATIPKNSSCTITVPVTSSVTGSYTNTIPTNGITSQQGVTNTSPASAPLTVQGRSVNASKAFVPNNPYVGDNSVLTINLSNPTFNSPYTNLSLTDNLPTNVQVTTPAPTTTCGGTVNSTISSVTLSGGTLAPQANCTITVNVKAVGTGSTTAAQTNTIPANSITTAQGTTNAQATANVNPRTRTISVAKAVSSSTLPVNGNTTFTISLTNPTTSTTYNNLSFTDNLSLVGAGLTVSTAPSTTCSGGTVSNTATTVSLAGGTLAPGASCTVTFGATATTAGTYTNRIATNSVTTAEGVTGPSSNVNRNVTFTNLSLTVAKVFAPSPVNINTDNTLTITITNPTTTNLTGLNLTDNLPSGLTIKTGTTPTTTCTGGTITNTSSSVSLTGASLLASANCTITAIVRASVGGVYTNTIPPANVSTDQGAGISSDVSRSLTVRSIDLTKIFLPTSVAVGASSTMSIGLTNRTGANLTTLTATDNLPAGLVVATPPTVGVGGCSGGSVTRVDGSPLTGGETSLRVRKSTALGNGSTCTVTLNVTPTSIGAKVNTINLVDVTNDQNIAATQPVSATLTGTSANIILTKQFLTNPVAVGVPTPLRVRIDNPTSTSNLTGLAVTDNLPNGLVVANPPNSATTCTGGTVSATPGGTSFSLSGGSLNQGLTCTFTVNVVATSYGTGTYTNTIPANAITTTQGRTNDTAATANLAVTGATVSKAFFPDKIAPGGRSTLTVTISNFNNAPLTGVQLTDNLPQTPVAQKITIAATPTNASTTCAGGTVSATPGGTSFSLNGATVPAAVAGVPGVCTFQADVTGTASGSNNTNTILTNSLISNEGISNTNSATAVLSFLPLNINVVKQFNPLTVSGGSTSTLIITLNNPTTENYVGVQFTDTMPTQMLVASPSNASTTCTDGIVSATPNTNIFSLTEAKIPANSSCTVTLKVTSIQAANLTNTIGVNQVTSFQGAKNTQAVSATLTNLPGVGVGKSFSPNVVEPNQIAQLTITVINAQDLALTGLQLIDEMPSSLLIANPSNLNNTCNGTVSTTNTPTSELSLTGGSLGPSSSCSITIDVLASSLGNYVNGLPAGIINNDQGASNSKPVTDTLMVKIFPTVNKSFNPATVAPGGISTLTINLGNATGTDATLISDLIDTLPTGIKVATTPNLGGTCNLANVIANPGGNTIKYLNGAIIPIDGCTITVDVTNIVSGTHTNTIPVGALKTTEGNNTQPGTATLTSGQPNLLLVKRITAINNNTGPTKGGTNDMNTYLDDPNYPYDDNILESVTPSDTTFWPDPTTFLIGAINGGKIEPGDRLEYTIYFLSTGDLEAKNTLLCDRIPTGTEFEYNTYGTGKGIFLSYKGSETELTNLGGEDQGQFFPPSLEPSNVNPGIDCGGPNTTGAVVVNLGDLPKATAPGVPTTSYGYVRFRVKFKN